MRSKQSTFHMLRPLRVNNPLTSHCSNTTRKVILRYRVDLMADGVLALLLHTHVTAQITPSPERFNLRVNKKKDKIESGTRLTVCQRPKKQVHSFEQCCQPLPASFSSTSKEKISIRVPRVLSTTHCRPPTLPILHRAGPVSVYETGRWCRQRLDVSLFLLFLCH